MLAPFERETETASKTDPIESLLIRTGLISMTPTIIAHRAETSRGMLGTRIADLATMTTEETMTTNLNTTTEVVIVATMVQAGESTTTLYAITAHLTKIGTTLLINERLYRKDFRRPSMHIIPLTIEITPEMNIHRMIQAPTIGMLLTAPTHPAGPHRGEDLLLRETISDLTTEILLAQRTVRMDLDTDHRARADLLRTAIQDRPLAAEEKEAIRLTTVTAVVDTRLHTTTTGDSVLLRISSTDIKGNHIVEVAVAVAAEEAASSECMYVCQLSEGVLGGRYRCIVIACACVSVSGWVFLDHHIRRIVTLYGSRVCMMMLI